MKILIASSICPQAIEELRCEHDVICTFNAPEEVLIDKIKDREVLIFRSGVDINANVLAAAPDLSLLIRAGSGLDNLDMDYVRAHGLTLERIPEPGAKAVAELTFALILAVSRRVVEAHELTSKGRWAKSEMMGNLITGKTLGVVGMGSIGTRVARLGRAWDMNVIGCVDSPTPERADAFRQQGIELTTFDAVVEQADMLTVHVPLTEATRSLIGAEVIRRMKLGAYLFSLARGGIVVEQALRDALVQQRLAGAGLDVHEREGDGITSPLADLPNVVLTPHIGSMAAECQGQIGARVLEIIAAIGTKLSRHS